MTTSGNCYKDAFDAIANFRPHAARAVGQEPTLVHGYPRLTGGPKIGSKYGHAWMEFGGLVYDVQRGEYIPRNLYYTAGSIEESECVRYTKKTAILMASQSRHYGPWERVPEDAIFSED